MRWLLLLPLLMAACQPTPPPATPVSPIESPVETPTEVPAATATSFPTESPTPVPTATATQLPPQPTNTVTPTPGPKPTLIPTLEPLNYRTVGPGDSLWLIAVDEYGDGTLYPIIRDATNFASQQSPPTFRYIENDNVIYVGEVLVIPVQ